MIWAIEIGFRKQGEFFLNEILVLIFQVQLNSLVENAYTIGTKESSSVNTYALRRCHGVTVILYCNRNAHFSRTSVKNSNSISFFETKNVRALQNVGQLLRFNKPLSCMSESMFCYLISK